jgi:fibrillarin-like rRNA methylase
LIGIDNLNKNNSRIIWENHNGRKKLYTITSAPKNQYRDWSPFDSKLSAALFNGLEIFPFKPSSKIFYSNDSSDTTLNHLFDIIDSIGMIYIQKSSVKIKNSKNVVMIDNEKDNTVDKHNGKEQFDVIYLDITNNQNLEAEMLNHETNLKNLGFAIIIFHSASKTNDSSFKNQINNIINHSALSLQLIQEVNLADFFKNNMMVVLQKMEKSFGVI